jgi:hypothetical protein
MAAGTFEKQVLAVAAARPCGFAGAAAGEDLRAEFVTRLGIGLGAGLDRTWPRERTWERPGRGARYGMKPRRAARAEVLRGAVLSG